MNQAVIFYPMTALALMTLTVLLLIPYKRFKASFARQVTVADFRYGESSRVPGDVSLPNRNMMNLLEIPVLFYVLCITLFVSNLVDPAFYYAAWCYFAARFLHSIVHLTYNNVIHRLTCFAVSNVILTVMWVRFLFVL